MYPDRIEHKDTWREGLICVFDISVVGMVVCFELGGQGPDNDRKVSE